MTIPRHGSHGKELVALYSERKVLSFKDFRTVLESPASPGKRKTLAGPTGKSEFLRTASCKCKAEHVCWQQPVGDHNPGD